jgi:aryl-alcohol dehydrogenase-like predicted oxidoreductase
MLGWTDLLEYSLIERTSERELLPMASALDVVVTAWSPLGGGVLTGKYRRRITTYLQIGCSRKLVK